MSSFTELLGLEEAKEKKQEYSPPPKERKKHEPIFAPVTPRNLKKEILSMFPTVTEIKNHLLAKKDTISADELKTLGRIAKEAIHIDRLIATIKEMIMDA